jgi:hypothetical protein
MTTPSLVPLALALAALIPIGGSLAPIGGSLALPVAPAAQAPQVAIPKPGVSEIMTIEGNFVRAAYNNEGYAILGYRLANLSLGEKWLMLEFGATVRDGVPAYDEVELSNTRACLGRLFFQLPNGIQYGQYWLNVKFQNSLVRVPFRILTKDEEKLLSKNYGDIRRQVEAAFKPKKKS